MLCESWNYWNLKDELDIVMVDQVDGQLPLLTGGGGCFRTCKAAIALWLGVIIAVRFDDGMYGICFKLAVHNWRAVVGIVDLVDITRIGEVPLTACALIIWLVFLRCASTCLLFQAALLHRAHHQCTLVASLQDSSEIDILNLVLDVLKNLGARRKLRHDYEWEG